ncbi:hypothetical protein HK405_010453, partial [Cladochytrium tenue]
LQDDWRVFWLRANRDDGTIGELGQQKLQRSEAVGFLRYHLEFFIRRYQKEIAMGLIDVEEGSQDDGDQALPDLPMAMTLHLHQAPFNIVRPA